MDVKQTYDLLPDALRQHSKIEDGHIVWDGLLTKKGGYAQVRIGDTVRLAHRIAYEAVVGSLRRRQLITRKCSEPRCINPHHYRKI